MVQGVWKAGTAGSATAEGQVGLEAAVVSLVSELAPQPVVQNVAGSAVSVLCLCSCCPSFPLTACFLVMVSVVRPMVGAAATVHHISPRDSPAPVAASVFAVHRAQHVRALARPAACESVPSLGCASASLSLT